MCVYILVLPTYAKLQLLHVTFTDVAINLFIPKSIGFVTGIDQRPRHATPKPQAFPN